MWDFSYCLILSSSHRSPQCSPVVSVICHQITESVISRGTVQVCFLQLTLPWGRKKFFVFFKGTYYKRRRYFLRIAALLTFTQLSRNPLHGEKLRHCGSTGEAQPSNLKGPVWSVSRQSISSKLNEQPYVLLFLTKKKERKGVIIQGEKTHHFGCSVWSRCSHSRRPPSIYFHLVAVK